MRMARLDQELVKKLVVLFDDFWDLIERILFLLNK